MKNILLGFLLGCLLVGAYKVGTVHAQAVGASTPFVLQSAGPITNCGPVAASGTATICMTNTGLAQSVSGSTYALIGGTAGVASWNGMTGAVTYTPPKTATISVPASTLTGTVQ
jgi:hypothetical protein